MSFSEHADLLIDHLIDNNKTKQNYNKNNTLRICRVAKSAPYKCH